MITSLSRHESVVRIPYGILFQFMLQLNKKKLENQ